jgi:hypothetical protein
LRGIGRPRTAPITILAGLVVAQLYLLVAPSLPVLPDADLSAFVAASCGAVVVILAATAISVVADSRILTGVVALGAGILVGGLSAAGVGAAATGVEALAYASAGALFATALLTPSLALTLPAFVALIDAASTTLNGPAALLATGATGAGDPLSLAFPDWGSGLSAGRFDVSDAVFRRVPDVRAALRAAPGGDTARAAARRHRLDRVPGQPRRIDPGGAIHGARLLPRQPGSAAPTAAARGSGRLRAPHGRTARRG